MQIRVFVLSEYIDLGMILDLVQYLLDTKIAIVVVLWEFLSEI